MLLVFGFALVPCVRALDYAPFDSAAASSVHTSGTDAFAPGRALGGGSGYWCSSGGHAPAQSVVLTGFLDVPRRALGLSVHWAYSPSELKVLVSADGANFVEAACWRASLQDDPAYLEHVMFEDVRLVRAVTLVMRGARAWGYFGVNALALLAEHAPIMLVSQAARAGEACVVATSDGVVMAPCLPALAAGTGNEVFRFNAAGHLASLTRSGECVIVADGDTAHGASLTLAPCASVAEAEDGRGVFSLLKSGQLKVDLGEACVVAEGSRLKLLDCEVASHSPDGSDLFYSVAVPELDTFSIQAARASAELALTTAARLKRQIDDLTNALPSLSACGAGRGNKMQMKVGRTPDTEIAMLAASQNSQLGMLTPEGLVVQELGVGNLGRAIAGARKAIADVRSQL